jgi:hypothetical protein
VQQQQLKKQQQQSVEEKLEVDMSSSSASTSISSAAETDAAAAVAATGRLILFNEDLYRRAVARERELLDRLRSMKSEVRARIQAEYRIMQS